MKNHSVKSMSDAEVRKYQADYARQAAEAKKAKDKRPKGAAKSAPTSKLTQSDLAKVAAYSVAFRKAHELVQGARRTRIAARQAKDARKAAKKLVPVVTTPVKPKRRDPIIAGMAKAAGLKVIKTKKAKGKD